MREVESFSHRLLFFQPENTYNAYMQEMSTAGIVHSQEYAFISCGQHAMMRTLHTCTRDNETMISKACLPFTRLVSVALHAPHRQAARADGKLHSQSSLFRPTSALQLFHPRYPFIGHRHRKTRAILKTNAVRICFDTSLKRFMNVIRVEISFLYSSVSLEMAKATKKMEMWIIQCLDSSGDKN